MMELISLSCWAALILMIWFESDAFIHYSRALGFSLAFCITEYDNDPLSEQVDYLDFLSIRYGDSFWIKLITCPICLSVWITGAIILASGSPLVYFAVVNLLSLSLFFIIKRLY